MPPVDFILLYDGMCGLCNGAVRFILRHDRQKTMRFASLQSDVARKFLERHPQLRIIDSLILVESAGTPEESFFVQSDGVMKIADYLGGIWSAVSLFRFLPHRLTDAVYNGIARYRHILFGRYDRCPLPPPESQTRFLG